MRVLVLVALPLCLCWVIMYLSNVVYVEGSKHAELDPDARDDSSKCSPSDNLDVG